MGAIYLKPSQRGRPRPEFGNSWLEPGPPRKHLQTGNAREAKHQPHPCWNIRGLFLSAACAVMKERLCLRAAYASACFVFSRLVVSKPFRLKCFCPPVFDKRHKPLNDGHTDCKLDRAEAFWRIHIFIGTCTCLCAVCIPHTPV